MGRLIVMAALFICIRRQTPCSSPCLYLVYIAASLPLMWLLVPCLPTQDEVISFSHGVALHERCTQAVPPLWVDGAGHNDLELFEAYSERLLGFLDELDTHHVGHSA